MVWKLEFDHKRKEHKSVEQAVKRLHIAIQLPKISYEKIASMYHVITIRETKRKIHL